MAESGVLPPQIEDWFKGRDWQPHKHQRDMVTSADAPCVLLIAPTGGGKTLAGFLPTLADLAITQHTGLHTLYVSPLKALAADIKRNLRTPVEEIGLDIRIEDRTGDTSNTVKKRQRANPPHILLTTPESLALLTSYPDAGYIFKGLKRVIVDEIHALAESKRGDQLFLALARLQTLQPNLRRVGLSATVDQPRKIASLLACHPASSKIIMADPGPDPDIAMLETEAAPPWSGGGAIYAISAVLNQVRKHNTTLIFHNTRAQAEIFFHHLWLANDDGLPIGIHHGSLDREQRQRVESAMVRGDLRAIVCTGSLDLGIDWGNVDLVIQVGAPKNVKRLLQRIGRANHRYNAPSKAFLVPANRWEIIECVNALQAARERDLDGDARNDGPLDVLCQHILLTAASGPFNADDLFLEIKSVGTFIGLDRLAFDACLDFCATGGYALRAYDRWQRLQQRPDGQWQLRDPRAAAIIRMNAGTIQDTDTLKVRLRRNRGGKPLGEIEENFAASLSPGDTFLIGGQIVKYEGLREMTVEVSPNAAKKPRVATFSGTKFSTSTQLSQRILRYLQKDDWSELPKHTADWLRLQSAMSRLPEPGRLLVESFPRDGRENICIYGFAGLNAQQTLGLLLTKRMEEIGLAPMGFVATDYATLIWGMDAVTNPIPILEIKGLQEGLDGWLAGNSLMKRTFRGAATIAGLIERNTKGKRQSSRQATFSSDILYDTLLKYDPNHLLIQITRKEAMSGLVDFARIEEMLDRVSGHVDLIRTPHVTPFSAPLFLEVGKISVQSGSAEERLLAEEAEALIRDSGLSQM